MEETIRETTAAPVDEEQDDMEINEKNRWSAAYEKETVINFNNAESTASYYTLNSAKRQMLLNLAKEYPDDVKITKKTDDMVEAVFPKSWIKVRPPRKLTDDQRAELVERGKALAAKRAAQKGQENVEE